jgi:hypothetical protein
MHIPVRKSLWCVAVFSDMVQLHTQQIALTVVTEFLCYSVTSEFMANMFIGTCFPDFFTSGDASNSMCLNSSHALEKL